MTLDDLVTDVNDAYDALGDELVVELDRETRMELAFLETAFEPASTSELVRRAVHMLFQSQVDRAAIDFQLRSLYDVTYDEYLAGMTFDEMTGNTVPKVDDERRYQF